MATATGWSSNSSLRIMMQISSSRRASGEELSGVVVGTLADELYGGRGKFVFYVPTPPLPSMMFYGPGHVSATRNAAPEAAIGPESK